MSNSFMGEPMIEEAERILKMFKEEELIVSKEGTDEKIVYTFMEEDKKKEEKSGFGSWFARRMTSYQIFRGDQTPQSQLRKWQTAIDLVRGYDYGHTKRFFEKGDGLLRRLSEAETLVTKLTLELKNLTDNRDGWKRRYNDCESKKFGTGVFMGDVEESR